MKKVCLRTPQELHATLAQKKIERSERPVVVQFYSPGCGHCQAVRPHIDELQRRLCDQADVVRVNLDLRDKATGDMAEKYGVEGLPTVAVFKGGKPVASEVGATTADAYEKMVRGVLTEDQ